MTTRRRKALYWLLKILSVLVSGAFPIWAIYERYPIWTIEHGVSRSIGTGGILILFVVIVIARRTIFEFFRERLNLRHAPPLLIWLVPIVLSYTLLYIGQLLYDITNIFWMGFIGCAIGTALTFIAENFLREKNDGA